MGNTPSLPLRAAKAAAYWIQPNDNPARAGPAISGRPRRRPEGALPPVERGCATGRNSPRRRGGGWPGAGGGGLARAGGALMRAKAEQERG